VTKRFLSTPLRLSVTATLRVREAGVVVSEYPSNRRRRLDPERFDLVLQDLDHFGEWLALDRDSVPLHPCTPGATSRAVELPVLRYPLTAAGALAALVQSHRRTADNSRLSAPSRHASNGCTCGSGDAWQAAPTTALGEVSRSRADRPALSDSAAGAESSHVRGDRCAFEDPS